MFQVEQSVESNAIRHPAETAPFGGPARFTFVSTHGLSNRFANALVVRGLENLEIVR